MRDTSRLCIVIPCYNEEASLCRTVQEVDRKLTFLIDNKRITNDSYMLLVDDGSIDSTWDIIAESHALLPERVRGLRFAANRGKETALWAGVADAEKVADMVVCMDADLQFDINAIEDFLDAYYEGYELVYGIKRNRGKESWIKTACAAAFYKLMRFLGAPIAKNHTDYCLMTRNVCNARSEYHETHLIFRGLLKNLGFKQKCIEFDVLDREKGTSHFSLTKLLALSIDAITSFSVAPLRLIALGGSIAFLIGIIMTAYSLLCYFNGSLPPSGYTTITCSMWMLGGIQMLSLGIMGEYMGKLYIEAKRRPRFYISEKF